jgi:hypothetical protein
VIFRGEFRGIFWKNNFSKHFPRKIPFFPNIFWEKIFRAIFPGKMYEKSAPGVNILAALILQIAVQVNKFGQ